MLTSQLYWYLFSIQQLYH